MTDMDDSRTSTPKRVIALGIFLILFGLALGILTMMSIVGPILGLLLMGFGIFIIWKSSQGRPPETLP